MSGVPITELKEWFSSTTIYTWLEMVTPSTFGVTVVETDVVPLGPDAVAVYVVTADGVTVTEPLGTATEPMPLSIVNDVAFCVVQLNVVAPPAATLEGVAVIVACGAGGGGGGGGTLLPPPQPEMRTAPHATKKAFSRKVHSR